MGLRLMVMSTYGPSLKKKLCSLQEALQCQLKATAPVASLSTSGTGLFPGATLHPRLHTLLATGASLYESLMPWGCMSLEPNQPVPLLPLCSSETNEVSKGQRLKEKPKHTSEGVCGLRVC